MLTKLEHENCLTKRLGALSVLFISPRKPLLMAAAEYKPQKLFKNSYVGNITPVKSDIFQF